MNTPEQQPKKSSTIGKVFKFGCLPLIGLFVIICILGAILAPEKTEEQKSAESAAAVARAEKEKAQAELDAQEAKLQAAQKKIETEKLEKQAPTPQKKNSEPVEQKEDKPQAKEEAPITWNEINKIYGVSSKQTELKKNTEWKKYEGKRVRWKGEVSEVNETFGTMTLSIKMNSDTITSDIMIRLNGSEREKAINLEVGNSVEFEGTLSDWGTLMPITAKDGIIIK